MSTADFQTFYNQHIAPLPPRDRLLLASQILAELAESDELAGRVANVATVRHQREALKRFRGVVEGLEPDASVRHDNILYGA